MGSYDLFARTDAEAAEDAIVFQALTFVWSFFNPQFTGKVLNERNLRASCQKELDKDASCLEGPFRMGLYVDPFPNRIVAGRDHS
jgi:hypothetical protein